MWVHKTPWKREKHKNSRRRQGGIGSPVAWTKSLHTSVLPSQRWREKPIESLEARGRFPRPTPFTVTPSSNYLKCLEREREGRARKRRSWGLWAWTEQRKRGCCGRGVGLSWGWSHTCTASPRSRRSAAGTGPAMKSPLDRREVCAPSIPPRRWGTVSSPRPSPAPGQRAVSANVYFQCQKSTRGQTLSGLPNRCLDQFP